MVTVLLTGRGENTLKDKNLLNVLGHPVMYYPAIAGINARTVDKLFVSSDDEKILDFAYKLGYESIKRPIELALPTSQHEDVIRHAINFMNKLQVYPEIIVVILANNISIDAKWIDDCVNIMKKDMTITAVTPVYIDNDHHPLRAKKLDANDHLIMFMQPNNEKISTNRQDLEDCYYFCHNFWVLNVQELLNEEANGQPPWRFMGNKVVPYILEGSIDIHSEFDLRIAAEWLTFYDGKISKWKL